MTTTISLNNKTMEPCTFIVDGAFLYENLMSNTVSFTGTSYKVFIPGDSVYSVFPILYGTTPYIEEETPTDRTWVITLDEGRVLTEGWAE